MLQWLKTVWMDLSNHSKPFYLAYQTLEPSLSQGAFHELCSATTALDSLSVEEDFLKAFAPHLGEGTKVGFATTQMAFFVILKALDLSIGDEVILSCDTPLHLQNAIHAIGGKPVLTDMDDWSFGTDLETAEKKITTKTKAILVRHAYGISSNMEAFQKLAEEREIPLIEDCTQAYESYYQEKPLGSFGDFALFALDYGSPFQRALGGICYSKVEKYAKRLQKIRSSVEPAPISVEKALYRFMELEVLYSSPKSHARLNLIRKLMNWFQKGKLDFSSLDWQEEAGEPPLAYPMGMPKILSTVGKHQLADWKENKGRRKQILVRYISLFSKSKLKGRVQPVYVESQQNITPLCFLMATKDAPEILQWLEPYLDLQGYPAWQEQHRGEEVFLVAEHRQDKMLYLPIAMHPDGVEPLFKLYKKMLKELKLK